MSIGDEVALGVAAGALVLVVWLFRELYVARRWRQLTDALYAVARALDDLDLYVGDEPDEGDERETTPEP